MVKFTTVLDTIDILEYDGRKISLSTEEGKPVKFQMPRMYMPFGIGGFTPAVGNTKWSIDFSLKGYDEEGNYVKLFYETLLKIEDKIITAVAKHSPDREPKFRVKVDVSGDNTLKTGVFNSERQHLKDELKDKLYARNSGVGMVEMSSVYFLNKQFGITWKLHQLIVHEPQQLKGFQFVL